MAKNNLSKKANCMDSEDLVDFEKYYDSDESLGILSLSGITSEDDLFFDKNESVEDPKELYRNHILTEEYNIPFSKHYSMQNFFTKLHPIKEDDQTLKSTDSFSEQVISASPKTICNLSEAQKNLNTTITFQNVSELNKLKNENDLNKLSPTCNVSKFPCTSSLSPFQKIESVYCSTPKNNASYTFDLDEFPNSMKEPFQISPLNETIVKTKAIFAQSNKLDYANILFNRTAVLTSETHEDSNIDILNVTHNIDIPLDIYDSKLNKTFDMDVLPVKLESKNETFNLKKIGGDTHEVKVSDRESMCKHDKNVKDNFSNVKYQPGNCEEGINSNVLVSASCQDQANITHNVLNETVTMLTEVQNFNLDNEHTPHKTEIMNYDKNIKDNFSNVKYQLVNCKEGINSNALVSANCQDQATISHSILNETVTMLTVVKNPANITRNVLNKTVTMPIEVESFNLDKEHTPHKAEIMNYDKNIKDNFSNVKYEPGNCKEMNSNALVSASCQDQANITHSVLNETVTLLTEVENPANITRNVLNKTVTMPTEIENFNLDKELMPHKAEIMNYDKNLKDKFSNFKYQPGNCNEGMNSNALVSASCQDQANIARNVLNETVTMFTENEIFNLDKKHLSHNTEIQNIAYESIDELVQLPKIEKPPKSQKQQTENMKMTKIARTSNLSTASNSKCFEFDKKKTRKSFNFVNKNMTKNQNMNDLFGDISSKTDDISENQSLVVQKYPSYTTTDSKSLKTVCNSSRIPQTFLAKKDINTKFVPKNRSRTHDNSFSADDISSKKPSFSVEKKQKLELFFPKTTHLINSANSAAKVLKENVSSVKQDLPSKKFPVSNGRQNSSIEPIRYTKRASISNPGAKEKIPATGVQGKRLSFQSALPTLTRKIPVRKTNVPEMSAMKKTETKASKVKSPSSCNLR